MSSEKLAAMRQELKDSLLRAENNLLHVGRSSEVGCEQRIAGHEAENCWQDL
jgi:hypothetical protein